MAVLALGFVGQAIGAGIGGSILGVSAASIGGFVGSFIGGYVDNLLFPQKQEGPQLDDLTVTVSTYGNPIPRLYGPENPITGNVIWSTGLLETVVKSKQGGKGAPSVNVTQYTYRASVAVALGEGVLRSLKKIWANSKVIYDADDPATFDSQLYSAIRFYTGATDQLPDPTIESYDGVGNVPAYRGTAYVVIADLQLADYGNRLPNFKFLVEAHESIDAGAVANDIIARCGIDPNSVGSATVRGDVRGYAIGRAASGVGGLQPLALVYDFDVGEEAGSLRLTNRESGPVAVVPLDHLAGHTGDEKRPEAIRWSRAPETDLPRSATVTFPDPSRDYQPNSQTANRSQGSADSNLTNDVPIVMDVDTGRRLADRTLWEAWTGRQTAEAQTDDRWVNMQVGRTYVFQTPAGLEPLRVTRKTRGANGVIQLGLRRDRAAVYRSTAAGGHGAIPANGLKVPGPSEVILLDIPLLLDADDATQASGFYWGIVGSGDGWRGADLVRALDVSGPYDEVAPQGLELTAGDVVGTLGADPGVFSDPWDMVNTLRVTLRRPDMALESMTEAQVLAGGNAAYVGPADGHGGEIIQFLDATPTGTPGQYDLTGLLRGRKGTEFATGTHGADELFVLLEVGPLRRADFGLADLEQERAFKGVSLLTLEADADAILWTNTGVGLRPYSPVDLMDTGDTGEDVVLSWTRRSRIGEGVTPPPLAEESERYWLRIMDGPTVVREILSSLPSFTYTAAMQQEDFGTAMGAELDWYVAQLSAVYGAGISAGIIGGVHVVTSDGEGSNAAGAQPAGEGWQVN